ncbi:MAG TPA: hypothetical protein VFT22_40620 [Kofleriaceae bacterium]|nr:hypothetical protein [Kofleriaceae bacterium]
MSKTASAAAAPQVLAGGDSVQVQGSSASHALSRKGDVVVCSCPAWRNQGATVDRRTCKHLRAYLGDDAETWQVGAGGARPAASSCVARSAAAVKKDTAPILITFRYQERSPDRVPRFPSYVGERIDAALPAARGRRPAPR